MEISWDNLDDEAKEKLHKSVKKRKQGFCEILKMKQKMNMEKWPEKRRDNSWKYREVSKGEIG